MDVLFPAGLFISVSILLMFGYPVAFTLAGTSIIVACVGAYFGYFDWIFFETIPSRIFGIMNNMTLVAVPLFVFMGVTLEKSKIAERLLSALANMIGNKRGGLSFAVLMVGALMAASTGIVGATVVTLGLMALPVMLKQGYDERVATGIICAAGTLGQIVPPSIVLVLLGDVVSNAYQQAQINSGVFNPKTISVGQLFIGALLPALILIGGYVIYLITVVRMFPNRMPMMDQQEYQQGANAETFFTSLVPPLLLISSVLGSIIIGAATPTEAAAVGAIGALFLAACYRQLSYKVLRSVMQTTVIYSSMVFMILIGASVFSLVFRGFGGDDLVNQFLTQLPGGTFTAVFVVMVLMFLLGFILDFIEITFVVVPIVGPVLLSMGVDPIWLAIMIAINLQTSFLTPPFGFSLFYLRGVAPKSLKTLQIYKGVLPFIGIQLLVLALLAVWPALATWLPGIVFS